MVTLSFDELNQIHNTDVPERLLNAKKVLLIGGDIRKPKIAEYLNTSWIYTTPISIF